MFQSGFPVIDVEYFVTVSIRILIFSLSVFVSGILGCDSPSKNALPSGDSNKKHIVDKSSFDFRDVTDLSGVNAVYQNGEESHAFSIVESLGGGVGALDFDLDSRVDLFFPGGGTIEVGGPLKGLPSGLWRNTGQAHFVEATTAAMIPVPKCYTHGCAAGDVDNDGFIDILVTGYGGLQFLKNLGDGTFIECTEQTALLDDRWSSSAAWGDFDEDGNIDLYVAHYVDWSWSNNPKCPTANPKILDVCTPNDFGPLQHEVYLSNGDGTFRTAGKKLGIDAGGKGLGVLVADFNDDSHVDVYVANDTTINFLYLNDGSKFEDIGLISGAGLDGSGTPNGSMGLATLDFDENLLPDIWVTNYENETYALYENGGDGRFLWATERAGLNALGKLYVGFGTISADLDLDGDEDIVVANGHVMLHPNNSRTDQQSVLLGNVRSGKNRRLVRQEFPKDSYFSSYHRGRGVVTSDLDQDGDLDLVFTNTREKSALLLNDSVRQGSLFAVRLIGTACNRDAIGAQAVVTTTKRKLLRTVVGGGSYLSQGSYGMSWGIPEGEQVISLTIKWPNGSTQSLSKLTQSPLQVVVQGHNN